MQKDHQTTSSGEASKVSETDADYFDGGWCWMAHPSRNDGNAIPVFMKTVDGTRFYHPLDPMDATEFEWDQRDDDWQVIVPAMAATLVDAAPELLEALRLLVRADESEALCDEHFAQARAAIAKATGEHA